jgi:hypothetical protein
MSNTQNIKPDIGDAALQAYHQVELPLGGGTHVQSDLRFGPHKCKYHLAMAVTGKNFRVDIDMSNDGASGKDLTGKEKPKPVAKVEPKGAVPIQPLADRGAPFKRVTDFQFLGPSSTTVNDDGEPFGPDSYRIGGQTFEVERKVPGARRRRDIELLNCERYGEDPSCDAFAYKYADAMYVYGFHNHGDDD